MTPLGLLIAARNGVRANRLRSVLSTVSIAAGVIAVTLVVAVGELAQEALTVEFERTTGRAATLEVTAPGVTAVEFTELHGLIDQALPEGRSSVVEWRSGTLLAESVVPATLRITDTELPSVRRLQTTAGRWFRSNDADLLAPPVVLNRSAVLESGITFPGPEPVSLDTGTAVMRLTVLGFVDDSIPEPVAYLPVGALDRWDEARPDQADTRLLVHVREEQSKVALQVLRHVTSTAGHADSTVQRVDDVDTVRRIVRIAQLAIGGVGLLAVIVGILGILNVGLVTVRERTQEFGVRRSFGATRGDIFRIVVFESVVASTIAGVVGVVASMGLARVIVAVMSLPQVSEIPNRFPLWVAAGGVLMASAAGLLGAVIPARQATRLSVVDAIRR